MAPIYLLARCKKVINADYSKKKMGKNLNERAREIGEKVEQFNLFQHQQVLISTYIAAEAAFTQNTVDL